MGVHDVSPKTTFPTTPIPTRLYVSPAGPHVSGTRHTRTEVPLPSLGQLNGGSSHSWCFELSVPPRGGTPSGWTPQVRDGLVVPERDDSSDRTPSSDIPDGWVPFGSVPGTVHSRLVPNDDQWPRGTLSVTRRDWTFGNGSTWGPSPPV